ncbi:amylo-alpha-1,6-glucosidase [Infirmifilum sp. SLHALR2]|nr:MAG: hypothetical protein B7L53_00685 [Thermofilum sp. NZ13]
MMLGERYSPVLSKAREVLLGNVKVFNGYRVVVPHLKAYPVPYCWDTAFHVLGLVHVDPVLAKENIESLLLLMRDDGLIPNAPLSAGNQDLRSQPPIIHFAVEYYLRRTGDRESVRRWFPRLKQYYRWWSRNGNLHGRAKRALSPFTGAREGDPEKEFKLAYWAVCSTGMDNHPTYDVAEGRTVKVGDYYFVEVLDPFLTASLAASARSMSIAAEELGLGDERRFFESEHEELSNVINELFWSSEDGFYYPLTWSLQPVRVKSVQAFTILYAGAADKGQAAKLVSHLTSEKEFWGQHGVPTAAFDDPKYMSEEPDWLYSFDPYYWSGPIWPPTTALAAIGLTNYSYRDLAISVARKWLDLMASSLNFAEYYYADGKPGITNRFNFGWTAAVTVFLGYFLAE